MHRLHEDKRDGQGLWIQTGPAKETPTGWAVPVVHVKQKPRYRISFRYEYPGNWVIVTVIQKLNADGSLHSRWPDFLTWEPVDDQTRLTLEKG